MEVSGGAISLACKEHLYRYEVLAVKIACYGQAMT
jgi:hypothetical protein